MRFLFSLVILTLFTTTIYAQKGKPAVDKRLQGLDTALNKLVGDWKAAGFAVAVVEKDKIVYAKGFGYRDVENKKPVTPNTLFAIGSSTKAFTSAVLGILQKEGKLNLNDKVKKHLPEVKFFNDDMDRNITIRDLMTHRTGLPRHDYSWYIFKSESRDSLMRRLQYQEPSADLRTTFQYNNFMFLLQGMIAEKYYGKSWEAVVKEKILDPLGMKRSVMSIDEMIKDDDVAKGYYVANDSIIKLLDYYNIGAMGPAGAINSSVNEVANWVITWIKGGKFNGQEIIPPNYLTDAISSHMTNGGGLISAANPYIQFSNYGLGWFLASYRGHYRVEHGGNIDGFSANVAFYPADSLGIIVLTNQNGSNVPNIARNLIADRMLNLSYVNWNARIKKEDDDAKARMKEMQVGSNRVEGTKPGHPLSDYEGVYTHAGYGSIDVYVEKDSLKMKMGADTLWLRHHHYDVFDIKQYREGVVDTSEGAYIRIVFRTNEAGKIESGLIPLEPTLAPLEFKWSPRAKPVNAADLEKYTGDYLLSGLTVKVYIKDEKLFVLVPGQPDYETVFAGDHNFNLKAINGYSVQFVLSESGEVTEMKFVQPNGIFTATKKK
ncbi:MAG: serine hydrolase [Chitinophagaceae bacterium]|nr:serine hydrolase [Chitinophagaceae bacterium]